MSETFSLDRPAFLRPRGRLLRQAAVIPPNNDRLVEVFQNTKTELPRLIAQVRTNLLMSPSDLAAAIGIRKIETYEALEKDLDPAEVSHRRTHYSRILEVWTRRGISLDIREQCLSFLNGGTTLNAFYERMGFDLGHEEVRQRICEASGGKTGDIYSTLWQREKGQRDEVPTVPTCAEVLSHVDVLYRPRGKGTAEAGKKYALRVGQAEDLWQQEMRVHYQARGLEPVLSEFLVALELDLARKHRLTLTQKALRDCFDFDDRAAESLIRGEFVEWDLVRSLLRTLSCQLSPSAMERGWKAGKEKLDRCCEFVEPFEEAMTARGLNYGDLARFLDVRAPEKRGKMPKVQHRSQPYRGDRVVHAVMKKLRMDEQVPVLAAIRLVARNPRHERDLWDFYVENRIRRLQRKGSWKWRKKEGFNMQIAREMAGIPDTIALAGLLLEEGAALEEVRALSQRLQRLEREEGEMTVARLQELRRIITVLERLSEKRAEEAVGRYERRFDPDPLWFVFSTMQEMVTKLKKIMWSKLRRARDTGGNAWDIYHAMKKDARDGSEWLRADLITRVEEGSYVPPLPALRLMPRACAEVELPEAVQHDWYARYPAYLRDRAKGTKRQGEHSVRDPLARILCTHVASIEGDPSRFFSERYIGGVDTKAAHTFYQFHHDGVRPDWEFIEGTLLAVGVGGGRSPDHNYTLAKVLFETRSVRQAVRAVLPLLKRARLEPHPSNLIGLTENEIRRAIRKGR